MKVNLEKETPIFLFNKSGLQKKSLYSKKLTKYILQLKSSLTKKQNFVKDESLFVKEEEHKCSKKSGLIVVYALHFIFSASNTFMYVTDAKGSLKYRSSAGLVGFKGKQKRSRFQVLISFLKELKKLKLNRLRNYPIALLLTNIGFHKRFLIRRLKKYFFIRFVSSCSLYSYNGCRKKKKARK